MSTRPSVVVDRLAKTFEDIVAVDGISFEIPVGESLTPHLSRLCTFQASVLEFSGRPKRARCGGSKAMPSKETE
jgi:hypothetical protein